MFLVHSRLCKFKAWLTATFCHSQTLPLFFSSFFSLLLSANSLHFHMTRFFPGDTDILYQGSAAPATSGAINFNDYNCQVGRAIYANRVPLWESSSGKLADFSTRYSFYIDTLEQSNYGHGLCFFLAPVGFVIPPNSDGGFLGLFNHTTSESPLNHIVHVEFDSFPNSAWDEKTEHVGINNNSIVSAVSTRWNASLHSVDTADVQITYNSSNQNLSVSWKYRNSLNPDEKTSISYLIDLKKVLPEWVTIGFSAATGINSERHILQSWEFSSTLEISDTTRKNTKETRLIVILTSSVSILLIGGAIAAYALFWKKKKRTRCETERAMNLTSINDDLERGAGPRRFFYTELVLATNNFSNDRKLGQGGFGAVYRGYFADLDLVVAVKKISSGSRQGRKEYVTEVKVISQLRHRNLVQLIGWCHDRGEFLLVYEFMSNGSLDSHLFGKKTPLTWSVRHKITLGLSSAVLYLHEEWERCVVHRDIKSSNVMLDSRFNVKLGDFGLAKLMDHEVGPQTTGLAGTFGYMAPEYVSTRRASKESDVYSFGMVALEIVTGRKAVDLMEDSDCEKSLVEWVWDHYGRGELWEALDERLQENFDKKQAECLMIVGLCCAHPDKNLRPSMRQAIQMLIFESPLPNLPPKKPVPTYNVPTLPLSFGEGSMSTTSLGIGR